MANYFLGHDITVFLCSR